MILARPLIAAYYVGANLDTSDESTKHLSVKRDADSLGGSMVGGPG